MITSAVVYELSALYSTDYGNAKEGLLILKWDRELYSYLIVAWYGV